MIKSFCALFLGASSLAWSMDAIGRENAHPNLPPQTEHTLEVFKKSEAPLVDHRTPEEIEKRIDFLEGQLSGYSSFNEQYCKVIEQLMDLNFFNKDFPQNNEEVLKILESVFTNDHGQADSWHPVVFELYRRPQSFIKRFIQLRDDVLSRESEQNKEIHKILTDLDYELRAVNIMIVYYLNNKS